ncbi:MAG TPA: sigma-70 family RNA polymerase sigma factor [Gemmatimonadaceae bacterium]
MDPEQLYLRYLEVINRIAESLCRRHGLQGADAEDFVADVRLKLLENDYAVIRKHRGDSSMTTFLTVVISNLFRDHRVKRWGRWRPSAEARRIGELAVQLETAVYRDGCSFDEACARVEQSTGKPVDRAELRRIMAKLPQRTPRRVESDEGLLELPAPGHLNGSMLDVEQRQDLEVVEAALQKAVLQLDEEDQLIIKLHYYEGMTLAEIARGLHLPPKPLYGRLRRLLSTLSDALTEQGISPAHLESFESTPP